MSKHNYTKYAANKNQESVVEEQEVQVVEEPVEVEVPGMVNEPEEVVEVEVAKVGVVANCKLLNVRRKPSLDADILIIINESDEVIVDDEESTDDFYKVLTESGRKGYCVKKYIEIR